MIKRHNNKLLIEAILSITFVLVGTAIVYGKLAGFSVFWSSQSAWNIIMVVCWGIVAVGYYHQGWLIHLRKSSQGVSAFLPIAVFLVQCILFVKGIYYHDWALIFGAVTVNSGVVFDLYQIWKVRNL